MFEVFKVGEGLPIQPMHAAVKRRSACSASAWLLNGAAFVGYPQGDPQESCDVDDGEAAACHRMPFCTAYQEMLRELTGCLRSTFVGVSSLPVGPSAAPFVYLLCLQ